MSRSPRRPARELRRAGLTRARVLGAAVTLADEGGLNELSMRKLARRLGVEAMSLYNHIANKERLLDGMIDHVLGEIDPPSSDGDWKQEMRKRAISTRAVLDRHRWAVGLMEDRTTPGGAGLELHEAVLASLHAAGFSAEHAIHAYSLQDAYIYGFALREKAIEQHAEAHGSGREAEFLFGLDLILDGLEQRLAG